jgi:hypothetical protein
MALRCTLCSSHLETADTKERPYRYVGEPDQAALECRECWALYRYAAMTTKHLHIEVVALPVPDTGSGKDVEGTWRLTLVGSYESRDGKKELYHVRQCLVCRNVYEGDARFVRGKIGIEPCVCRCATPTPVRQSRPEWSGPTTALKAGCAHFTYRWSTSERVVDRCESCTTGTFISAEGSFSTVRELDIQGVWFATLECGHCHRLHPEVQRLYVETCRRLRACVRCGGRLEYLHSNPDRKDLVASKDAQCACTRCGLVLADAEGCQTVCGYVADGCETCTSRHLVPPGSKTAYDLVEQRFTNTSLFATRTTLVRCCGGCGTLHPSDRRAGWRLGSYTKYGDCGRCKRPPLPGLAGPKTVHTRYELVEGTFVHASECGSCGLIVGDTGEYTWRSNRSTCESCGQCNWHTSVAEHGDVRLPFRWCPCGQIHARDRLLIDTHYRNLPACTYTRGECVLCHSLSTPGSRRQLCAGNEVCVGCLERRAALIPPTPMPTLPSETTTATVPRQLVPDTSQSARAVHRERVELDCIVCMDRKACTVLLTCGHLGLCLECAGLHVGKACPVCRAVVREAVRCYQP